MGSYYDLPSEELFGEFDLKVTIHVIDSARPQSLANLFTGGENGERIVTWDDGQPHKLKEEKASWEIVQVRKSLCPQKPCLTVHSMTFKAVPMKRTTMTRDPVKKKMSIPSHQILRRESEEGLRVMASGSVDVSVQEYVVTHFDVCCNF